VSTGQWKMSQVLCTFGLLDFTMLRPFSLDARFEIMNRLFFNFKIF
jgi:hypothetical protein